ncbi:hypothetical protein N7456_012329 [Penicillium angulare]|uniref:Fungal N-terminal domain-containing protein n=1 Tax=Penicillium angulare TaxID=116970 RepID=A0A9W9EVC9_9EURO|nr:hypothetical protein N7456_012329 [Penicillium angulare]
MVDPVGLISLGITVCQGLLTYYDQYKSFSEETNNILRRVNSLNGIFQALHDVLADAQTVNSSTSAKSKIALRCIADCEDGIKRLNDMLSKVMEHESGNSSRAKIFDRAMYPFRRKTLLGLLDTTRELQENLDTALHLLELFPDPSVLQSLIVQHQQVDRGIGELTTQIEPRRRRSRRRCTCFPYGQTSFDHKEGCRLYLTGQKFRGLHAKHVFCNKFLTFSVKIAFGITTGAGGFAICPPLEIQTMVVSSPAFEVLRSLDSKLSFAGPWERNRYSIAWAKDAFITVDQLFQDRRASLTDIDVFGKTIAHCIADIVQHFFSRRRPYNDATKASFVNIVSERELGKILINSLNRQGKSFFDVFIISGTNLPGNNRVDKDALRFWQTFLDEDSYWSLGTPGDHEDMNFLSLSFFEDFKDSIAVQDISTSEALEPLINRDVRLLKSNIEKGVKMPLYLYAFWTEGFQVLLNAGYSLSLQDSSMRLFFQIGHAEALRNILSTEGFILGRLSMRAITGITRIAGLYEITLEIIRLVVSKLGERRRRLQNLAARHLPSEILKDLMPNSNTLLGFQASQVYKLLKEYHVEFNDIEDDEGWVVYMHIAGNPIIADMLWTSGFRDIDEIDSHGFTTLMSRHDPWFSPSLAYADWLIKKGADIYLRRKGIPSLHYVAYNSSWRQGLRKWNKVSEAEERMLRLILEDDCQDSCDCACSIGGCYAATLLWHFDRDFIELTDMRFLSDFFKMKACLSRPRKMMSSLQKSLAKHAIPILRVLTFDALGIPHTCRHNLKDRPDPDEINDSMGDVAFLEELMLELIPMTNGSIGWKKYWINLLARRISGK